MFWRASNMSKLKESDLKKQISEYLMDQNRPFSANEILSNMHLDCGKTAFTRALDFLVSEGKAKEKTYGKQKVYFINQDLFNDSKSNDLQSMDAQIAELTNTHNNLQKQIKNLEAKFDGLDKSLTTEKAEAELKAVKAEVPLLENKLKSLQSKSGTIDPDEKKTLCGKKENIMKEYQRRKRLANNIIDTILEGYPKSKKQLLEELGVETDDDLKLQS